MKYTMYMTLEKAFWWKCGRLLKVIPKASQGSRLVSLWLAISPEVILPRKLDVLSRQPYLDVRLAFTHPDNSPSLNNRVITLDLYPWSADTAVINFLFPFSLVNISRKRLVSFNLFFFLLFMVKYSLDFH